MKYFVEVPSTDFILIPYQYKYLLIFFFLWGGVTQLNKMLHTLFGFFRDVHSKLLINNSITSIK